MEETSLTDFLEADGADAGDVETAESGVDGVTVHEDGAPAEAEPAETTAAWTREGATCEACGEPAAWRWRDEDSLVCGVCKDW